MADLIGTATTSAAPPQSAMLVSAGSIDWSALTVKPGDGDDDLVSLIG